MKELKIRKDNGNVIPCLYDIPENSTSIVIMVHGFTSSKSCPTAELLFRRMPERGIGVITYDQPAHGEEEAKDEELRLTNCIDSLKAVEAYAVSKYPEKKILYFASSFGAYVTGLYISSSEHAGRKAFFRSAAVIMPQLILGPELEIKDQKMRLQLEEKGYVEPDLGLGKTMRLTKGFADDLIDNNFFEKFDNNRFGHTDVEMIHGELDPVVPIKYAKMFADLKGLKFNIMEGEGHSICTYSESPDKVADTALDFFLD